MSVDASNGRNPDDEALSPTPGTKVLEDEDDEASALPNRRMAASRS